MARQRFDNLRAVLGGSLTDSATTATLVAPLEYGDGTAVPTISGGDYFTFTVLDADGTIEVVYVTAYTSGSTTLSTITRGQEGTDAIAHASGTVLRHGPTVQDFAALQLAKESGGIYPDRDADGTPVLFFGPTDPGGDLTSIDLWIQDGVTAPADEVTYDNTTSGLTATDVQAAIDELEAAGGGGGVTLEQVYDALATVLVAGTNMTITPNDGADTITFASSGGGGGGATAETVTASKTSAYTAAAFDFVRADATSGGFTVTLPGSPTTGDKVRVKKTDSSANIVTVAGTIDGATNWRLLDQWACMEVIYDGTDWKVTSRAGRAVPAGPLALAAEITYVSNANTVNATLPAGATAGQLAIIFAAHGFVPTTPTGSTLISGGTPASHGAYYKVLLTGDITNGYITVPFGGTFYGQVGIVTVSGANASPVRNGKVLATSVVGGFQMTNDPAGSVGQAGDLVIYWAASRHDSGTPTSLVIFDGTQIDAQVNTRFQGTLNYDILTTAGRPRSYAEAYGDVAEVGSGWGVVVVKA
jgi:hypothetical protein